MFSLLLCSAMIVACSSAKKQKTKGYQAKKEDSLASVAKRNNLDFQWLKGRFDADVDLGNEQIGFNASFRMKKDSVIWITISKMGFNVVKIVLTPDTVVVVDKIQGQYYKGNYAFFKDSLKTDIDFNLFQDILLGNFHPMFKEELYSAATEGSNHIYASPKKSTLGTILETGEFNKGIENINVIYLSMDTSRVERVYYQDPVKQYILDILYQSRQEGDFPFPKKMMLALKSGSTKPKKLDIDFSKIETGSTPLDVKISIPKEYVPIKIK
ncbi:MAG: DUF4292 domain-containing protein [Bacteroidetes bacterium]|nr:DUF4292 domain-containing protein [Bacteroidota bacterium]